MKARITNLGREPFSLDAPNSQGAMIRRLIAPGSADVVDDVDPWYLNQDELLRQLVARGGVNAFTTTPSGIEVSSPNGILKVEWLSEPDDLIKFDFAGNLTVRKNSVTIGARPALNFIEGTNVTLTVADDAGDDEIEVTIATTSAGKAPVLFGSGDIATTPTARWLAPGNTDAIASVAAEGEFRVPFAGSLKNMYVHHSVPSGAAVLLTYTVYVSGAATPLAVGLLASAGFGANTTIAVPVVAGDRISVRVVKAAVVAPAMRNVRVSMEIS